MKKFIFSLFALTALATCLNAGGYHTFGFRASYAAPVVFQSYTAPLAVATCGSAYSQNLVIPQIAPLQGAVNVTTSQAAYTAPVAVQTQQVVQAYTAPAVAVTQSYAAPLAVTAGYSNSLAIANVGYGHVGRVQAFRANHHVQNVVVRERLVTGRQAVVVQRQVAGGNQGAVNVQVGGGQRANVRVNAPGVRVRVRR